MRRLLGVKSGGCVSSGGSKSRGSSGMRRTVQNSLGRVAATGRIFLSTHLYLRTSTDGSDGGSGGSGCSMMICSGLRGEAEGVTSRTEIILTAVARPVQGHVVTYTLRKMSVGSCIDTSTSPVGRSSMRHRAACWNGRPRRSLKDACSMTCAWILTETSPICNDKFSAHPTVQLVALFAPSILIRW